MRILIVEDEFNLADVISESLKKEKYQVDIRTDGEEGYFEALTGIYDLIILDVMLPHMNGFDILKGLREENIESKIIMLTAKSITIRLDSSSKIKLTGDSYITSLEDEDSTYSNIDFNGYKLYVNGKAIN